MELYLHSSCFQCTIINHRGNFTFNLFSKHQSKSIMQNTVNRRNQDIPINANPDFNSAYHCTFIKKTDCYLIQHNKRGTPFHTHSSLTDLNDIHGLPDFFSVYAAGSCTNFHDTTASPLKPYDIQAQYQ
jgi:hypothetical protein